MVIRCIANRRHENVGTLIENFQGILHSDGYPAYTNYAELHPEIILTACWAHVFRKFRDAPKGEPEKAALANPERLVKEPPQA